MADDSLDAAFDRFDQEYRAEQEIREPRDVHIHFSRPEPEPVVNLLVHAHENEKWCRVCGRRQRNVTTGQCANCGEWTK
jgi:hypothetical protein